MVEFKMNVNKQTKTLAEQPAQQQEPEFASPGGGYVPAIPATPTSKPWVGLTPEQRASIAKANNMLVDDDLFDDIEAKLREKNEHR